MEENIQRILNEKDENVVQFNVVNTTPNPIFLDLFNTSEGLSTIPSSPTYIYPPNSYVGSFGSSASYKYAVLNTLNQILYAYDGLSSVILYDTANNNANVGTISVGVSNLTIGAYNSINNTIYFTATTSNNIIVIDCNTNTISATIPFTNPLDIGFNSVNNTMYVSGTSANQVIDCNTNTIIATIIAPTFVGYQFDSVNNIMYASDSASNIVYSIDGNTNIASVFLNVTSPTFLIFNSTDNTLYVTNNFGSLIDVYDCTNANLITGIIPPVTFLGTPFYDSNQNYIYYGSNSDVVVVNCNNNTILTTIAIPSATQLYFGGINLAQNSVYYCVSNINQIIQVTTLGITSTLYFITGSANYNAFVNNLNNEPVFIQMVRLLVQNQDQLNNELQLTKIDSNGNQIFIPNFPINQVSAYQQQGNIGEITLKDVVFDGRTYINQYQLNAYESLSFEIYYKQLDRLSATPTFPIFFKPKIQLKEYIKKELNL
jgi:hypothetical protein